MKALVFNGPRNISYESYADPELKTPNSVILKVNKCSICGSDLHIYHGETIGSNEYGDGANRFCVGHEFTGEIVEAGADVRLFNVGNKVLASGGTGCGECNLCLTGRSNQCSQSIAFGISPLLQGGQAEYVCVPNADYALTRIPDAVSDEQAILLTDAMATAFFGLTRTGLSAGETVAVVGLGPIGLIGVELAFLLGASKVFAIDPVAARRKQAEKLGATAFAPGGEAVGAVIDKTKGGVDRVFEASGAKAAAASTVKFVKRGGTVSFIGLPQPDVTLPLAKILFKDITIRAGVANPAATWKHLMPLLQSGRLKAADLFSHNMKLSEGAEAYRLFDAREDDVIKIMIDVD